MIDARPAASRVLTVVRWIAVLATVTALCTFLASDPDLGFHLATGRAVLALGRVPAVNVLSFAEPDHAWVLQQWLPAMLFELAWRARGFAGCLALKTVVVALTYALVLSGAQRRGASLALAAPVTVLAAWSAAFRFVERPLLFSNLALAAVALLLADTDRAVRLGLPSRRIGAPLVASALVTALACHVHAGALFTFALLAAVSAGLALEPFRQRILGVTDHRAPSGLRAAAVVALVGVVALVLAAVTLALYHPFGLRVLTVPFQMQSNAYLAEHLVEFRPPVRFPFARLAAFWALLALTLVALAVRVRHTSLAVTLPAVLFAFFALDHVRLVDSFAIVAVFTLASALCTVRIAGPLREGIAVAVLAGLCLAAPIDHWKRYPFGVGPNPYVWPMALFAAVDRARLHGPAYVSDAWAGPWIGLYYPHERAFFDPRFEAYSMAFYLDSYQSIRYGAPGWDARLDRYGVALAILRYTTPGEARFQDDAPNVRQHMARDPRWSLVAFDDRGEVFARIGSGNDGPAHALAIPGVDPDRLEFTGAPRDAARGLRDAFARGLDGARLCALAAVALDDAGDHAAARRIEAHGRASFPEADDVRRVAAHARR